MTNSQKVLNRIITCPDCNGAGFYHDCGNEWRCYLCEGSGTINPNQMLQCTHPEDVTRILRRYPQMVDASSGDQTPTSQAQSPKKSRFMFNFLRFFIKNRYR